MAVAERNLTIASDMLNHGSPSLEQPAFEWIVVLSYSAAVRSMNAGLLALNGTRPRTHAQRSRQILSTDDLRELLEKYADLENWSRDARYVSSPENFDEDIAHLAMGNARQITQHIRETLSTS